MTHHQHVEMFVDGVDGVGHVGLVDEGNTLACAHE